MCIINEKEIPLRSHSFKNDSDERAGAPLLMDHGMRTKNLYLLSGSEIMTRILDHDHPHKMVQALSEEDFFWLVKKVGDENSRLLLRLASWEQRQYLLDLELWKDDRFTFSEALAWMKRLKESDEQGLVEWLLGEGEYCARLFFMGNIELVQKESDEPLDLPHDFFTFDGTIYIRAINRRYNDLMRNILQGLYREDLIRTTMLLEDLAGWIAAELEEELYRLRNVRIAEHGFLPFDEALAIYSPLDMESLRHTEESRTASGFIDGAPDSMVPVLPLSHSGAGTALARAIAGITDVRFLDRIRIEFAGLCNQIASADGLSNFEHDTLVEKCRKAAGYVNLALEKTSEGSSAGARELLYDNSLETIFRAGYGLVMKLKWYAESWLAKSWSNGRGFEPGFWGERWGMTLSGLIRKKPLYFTGLPEQEYRGFEKLAEYDDTSRILGYIETLDQLLHRLDSPQPADMVTAPLEQLTYHPFIFTFWARHALGLPPSFAGISPEDVQRFFTLIRGGETDPPYFMHDAEAMFLEYFTHIARPDDFSDTSILGETLAAVWHDFREEYTWLTEKTPDQKFVRFLFIETGG
jgi:hypothetical protein